MPRYSGRQVVRLLGRLLTLALVLSLPLLLALLALHLAGYLPAPATRPRHAMVSPALVTAARHTARARPGARDLLAGSPDFAAIWARQDVRGRQERLKRFQHPALGRLDLEFTSFQVAEQPALRLHLYTPADDGRSETTLREAVAPRPGPSSGA